MYSEVKMKVMLENGFHTRKGVGTREVGSRKGDISLKGMTADFALIS